MPSRTTLHLPDGRSLPVSRSALADALPGLPDGESLRLETRNGAWMAATRTSGGLLLSYRLWEQMARYERPQVSEDMAADVLLDFAEAGSSWPGALAWREVEAAPEPEIEANLRDMRYADARAGGHRVFVLYALTRRNGSLALFAVAIAFYLFGWAQSTAVVFGLSWLYEGVAGALSDNVSGRGGPYRRSESPWMFAIHETIYIVVGGACVLIALLTRPTS